MNDEALAFATSLGATQVLHARRTPELMKAITDFTHGGAHVSLDALGSPETCRHSIQCLRKRGRHVQVGLMLAEHRLALVPMDLVIAKELEIYGSHGLQAHAYAPMLEMIQDGRLQPRILVRKRVTLEQAITELTRMGEFRGCGVTVIDRF